MDEYAEIMRDRVKELTSRYNSLMRTGNSRIEHYYDDVCRQSELQREEAKILRDVTQRDRQSIRNVETRIYDMAESFVQDHLKWVSGKLWPAPENINEPYGS